jgi:alkylated DNA repair protein alkB family protein 1
MKVRGREGMTRLSESVPRAQAAFRMTATDDRAYKKAKKLYEKSLRNRPPEQAGADWAPFRTTEKRFKARFPPPDLSDVLDLAPLDASRSDEILNGGWKGNPTALSYEHIDVQLNGEIPKSAYVFKSHPGFVYLPNLLSHQKQRDLVRWSLKDHARYPNETNLDTHYILPEEGLWNAHLRSRNPRSNIPDVQPKASASETDLSAYMPSAAGPRQLISNAAASVDNIGSLTLNAAAQPPMAPSPTTAAASPSKLLPKLRWANIGWFYHWGTKQYDFTRAKVDVAQEIKFLCQSIVRAVDWGRVFGDLHFESGAEDWETWSESYGAASFPQFPATRADPRFTEPDAGIVNFYQEKVSYPTWSP